MCHRTNKVTAPLSTFFIVTRKCPIWVEGIQVFTSLYGHVHLKGVDATFTKSNRKVAAFWHKCIRDHRSDKKQSLAQNTTYIYILES